MELWIPITIFAAFCQNVRTALQKHLKGRLGTTAATFVRFGYGCPFAVAYVVFLHEFTHAPLPEVNVPFVLSGMAGGLAQIAATFLLVHLFSFRNFAVGTAYSKTEPIQAALFGLVLLGETLSLASVLCIILGVVGVIVITVSGQPSSRRSLLNSLVSLPALIGLSAAGLFGASAAFYRSSSLSLQGTSFLMQAAFCLACVTLFQSVVMILWMLARDRRQLVLSLKSWRASIWVGLAGIAGSVGWFTAMTIQQVAYVRALAQIELVFTFIVGWLVFKERLSHKELAGCLLIVLAAIGIILLR